MDDRGLRLSTLLQTDQPTLAQALSTFVEIGQVGKSASTVTWYKKRLGDLVAYIGAGSPLVSVMLADLMDWIAYLESRSAIYGGNSTRPLESGGLSIHTIHGYIRATRHFFKWLYDNDVIPDNPAANLKLPKLPKTAKPGIAESDLRKILELARGNVRDYAVLRFFEATGCRLSGIVNLKLDDLNLDDDEPNCRRVMVCEKGDKDRTVFLTPGALDALLSWLAVRPDVDYPHVFLGKSPGQMWHPFTVSGVYGICRRYAKRAGVTKNWSPHQYRHRFARRLLQQGLGLSQVSQIMGHESVEITVKFYGQFAVGQLQDGYDRFMPDDF